MSFEKWLIKHRKQQNALGDLARDFISSKCETIEQSFNIYQPSNAAWDTYIKAKKCYMLKIARELYEILISLTEDREKPCIWDTVESEELLKEMLNAFISYIEIEEETNETD